jgi:hypothetical protein
MGRLVVSALLSEYVSVAIIMYGSRALASAVWRESVCVGVVKVSLGGADSQVGLLSKSPNIALM